MTDKDIGQVPDPHRKNETPKDNKIEIFWNGVLLNDEHHRCPSTIRSITLRKSDDDGEEKSV